jgi:translation initiation factor IF-1
MASPKKSSRPFRPKSQKTSHENPQNEKKDEIVWTGEVIQDLGFQNFSVMIPDLGQPVLAYPSGKMKMFKIRLLPGDKVDVKISPEDRTK